MTPFVLGTILLQRFPNHASCFLYVVYTIVLFTTTQPATTGSAAILVLLGPALLGYFKPVRIVDAVARFIVNGVTRA